MTTSQPSNNTLEVRHLSLSYRQQGVSRWGRQPAKNRVLHDISFTVESGTLTAIVGPSGCGKSSLLRVLAGLETPDSGVALLGGSRVTGKPGSVAFHPQQDALLPWLRALDNATLGLITGGGSRADAERRARHLLDRFGLSGMERAWPDELSGGMRQRVALMRTFLMPQGALLLDEPFGALDALTRRQLQQWLLGITATEARPTLLVTHDVDEALLLADEVLVLGQAGQGVVASVTRPAPAVRQEQQRSGEASAIAEQVYRALEPAETRSA